MWIIVHGSQYGELSFRSGDPQETAFAQGRWFVGQQIQKLIGLDHRLVALLRKEGNAGHGTAQAPYITDPDKHDRSGS